MPQDHPPPQPPKRPRGPLAWLRRRALSHLARLLALSGILLTLAWGAGRWFNDDHLWSQYLFWLPTGLVAALAWLTLLLSALCSKLSLRMGGVKLRPFLALGALITTAWMIHDWRPLNAPKRLAPRRESDVRVTYWNLSVERHATGAPDAILKTKPDIAIVANIRNDEHRQPILEALASLKPESSDGVHFRHWGAVTIGSRFPILRRGMARPRRVTTLLNDWRSEHDTGRITFTEFDTGGELTDDVFVVWVVDLPSDPTMPRSEVMDAAARAVAQFEGPAYTPDALGRWLPAPLPEGALGFPEPDLIIGDFNTPRGSRSLRLLVGDARSAHAQGGLGPAGTWTRTLPLWAIDQAFTGDRVRAVRTTVVDPGMSEHRMLVVDLQPR